ncbi:FG-GAP repeat domain-containing protein, partial [Streptomyces sp. NPDC058872]|uniref:FG-GAP repeat domain-containing protein n=1 Tax=Streptomyces sp. NPDC058872 TaxID=3346661 RepID=UPI0036B3F03B
MRTRLATCTALALSAGMLLAGPASADAPLPVPSTEKAVPSFTAPKLTLPKQDGARAGVASAEAVPLLMSDLDGDGSEDMIVRTPGGNLHSITSSGNGTNLDFFRDDVAKEIIPIGNQGGFTTEPEVLVASEDGTLTLYSDVDPSGTPYAHRVGGGWQVYNKITSPGDVNGDGRADVVARTKDGQLYLYLATGDTSAPLAARTLIGGGWNIYDQVMGLGDGTGDGKGDLYARDTAGDLWFYAGTGDTARPFAARVKVGTGWHIYNQILPAGGGNLLARDNYGTLYYYQGKGNGTLAAREQASVSGDFAGIVQFAGGGGNPYTGKEGVYAGTSNGALYWYTNSTTGSLTPRTSVSDTGTWDGFKLTNLSSMDRDGFSDLAFQYNDDPEGHLYIESEDIGRGWSAYNVLVGPGDLSGDGKGDLLARDRSGIL